MGRFLVEFFKERQGPFDDFVLSRGQLLSIIPFTFGLILLIIVLFRKNRGISNIEANYKEQMERKRTKTAAFPKETKKSSRKKKR
jgi:prolipoprotein diacylglyceryltransferase